MIYLIKKILNHLQLNIVKNKYIEFNNSFHFSKLDLLYCNIIRNYELKNLITSAGKRLGSFEDPYYYALKCSLPIVEKELFIKLFVKYIKNKIQRPRKASEALGLRNSKILAKYPEWSLVLPWQEISIEDKYNSYVEQFVKKRSILKSLYSNNYNKNNGDFFMYHDLALKSHAEQFYQLYKSIRQKGFENIGIIPVHLFIYNKRYRLSLADDGNHRIRVAYVLGKKSVPIKISKIVDIRDFENWYNVKNKLYTGKEAKKIFIDYFNFKGNGSYV